MDIVDNDYPWKPYNPVGLYARSTGQDTELVFDFYERQFIDPEKSTEELVWVSAEEKWKKVVRNSDEWDSAELNWKKVEEDNDSDEWKAAEREWNEIQLKMQRDRLFELSIYRLVDDWFKWLNSNDHNSDDDDDDGVDAHQRILPRRQTLREENYRIRDHIEYLRVRCGYDEDSDFLDFLKMMMPSGLMSSPIEMLNSEIIRYREDQCEKYCSVQRKEYMSRGLIFGLCRKTREIPLAIVLRISPFVSLLKKLPAEMYSDTCLARHENRTEYLISINWVSLRHHSVR